MPELSVGPVVTPIDVEVAVRDMLADSIPFYLSEADAYHDLDRCTTTPPRLYVARNENERWDEETPPVLVVACPQMTDMVKHAAAGKASYGAWFPVNIAVSVGGATEEGTRALAGRHLAAVLLAVAGQSDMGGLAEDTRIRAARTDPIGPQRTLMGCETVIDIYVGRVLDTRNIPRVLPENPCSPADPTPTPATARVRVRST